ncbi:hypothetical protein RR46_05058 [Papilio xuthus]|uniref:Uncharacterized protein n=1 Tax=Papilio xuthus TaxID=66420 RepID=A0A194Q8V9_PAPXU|nr:hypothetical protein RR46_05058 [Papilio xuthus]
MGKSTLVDGDNNPTSAESDPAKLLEAALLQMDGIIAGNVSVVCYVNTMPGCWHLPEHVTRWWLLDVCSQRIFGDDTDSQIPQHIFKRDSNLHDSVLYANKLNVKQRSMSSKLATDVELTGAHMEATNCSTPQPLPAGVHSPTNYFLPSLELFADHLSTGN